MHIVSVKMRRNITQNTYTFVDNIFHITNMVERTRANQTILAISIILLVDTCNENLFNICLHIWTS